MEQYPSIVIDGLTAFRKKDEVSKGSGGNSNNAV